MHVLRSRLVMDYTTSYFPLIVLGYGPLFRVRFGESLVVRLYSEIDHLYLSIEAQCVSHLLPSGDCHIFQAKCQDFLFFAFASYRVWIQKRKFSTVHAVSPWGQSEACENQMDTMSQLLPVRGVGTKIFFFEFGHQRRPSLSEQIRSWKVILNGLNMHGPKCHF